MMKRVLDVVLAGAGIVLLSPVFVIAAVAILIDSGRPILFRQVRVGRDYRPFVLYKLRSMSQESTGLPITADGDPRVTCVGRLLRSTKLDELPQLINVIRGDMSLVGPRPEVQRYVDLFHDDYVDILAVRPGITDLASVKYRNESQLLAASADPERTYLQDILPDKIALSKEYVGQHSMRLDLRILIGTVVRIAWRA